MHTTTRLEQEQFLLYFDHFLVVFVVPTQQYYIGFFIIQFFIHNKNGNITTDININKILFRFLEIFDLHTKHKKDRKIILFINDDHGILTRHEQVDSSTVYTKT